MKTNTQLRYSFYRFAMSLSSALLICTALLWITDTHASQLERVCQKGFIGYNYNPRLAKRCDMLWQKWTWEIKQSFNVK